MCCKAKELILVIRLGALGDFIESFPAFEAIRRYHRHSEIILLTTPPFQELAIRSPWFDQVIIDQRKAWYFFKENWKLWKKIKKLGHIARVYDLQTSNRTALYSHLIKTPLWNGHVKNATNFRVNRWRDEMHTRTRQHEQLSHWGLKTHKKVNCAWLFDKDVTLPKQPYIVLVPGVSPQRKEKSWPVERYIELSNIIEKKGRLPVIVGTSHEKEIAQTICRASPALDLTSKTSLPQLATIFLHACAVVGNDTGPMHLAAMVGQRCIVIFSKYSVPSHDAPLGYRPSQVDIFWVEALKKLSAQEVAFCLFDGAGAHVGSNDVIME